LQKETATISGLTRRLRGGAASRGVSDPAGDASRGVCDPAGGASRGVCDSAGGSPRGVSDPGGDYIMSSSPDLSSSGDEKKTLNLSQSPTERSVSFAPIVEAVSEIGDKSLDEGETCSET